MGIDHSLFLSKKKKENEKRNRLKLHTHKKKGRCRIYENPSITFRFLCPSPVKVSISTPSVKRIRFSYLYQLLMHRSNAYHPVEICQIIGLWTYAQRLIFRQKEAIRDF